MSAHAVYCVKGHIALKLIMHVTRIHGLFVPHIQLRGQNRINEEMN